MIFFQFCHGNISWVQTVGWKSFWNFKNVHHIPEILLMPNSKFLKDLQKVTNEKIGVKWYKMRVLFRVWMFIVENRICESLFLRLHGK